MSSLEEISVFTTGEDRPLKEIFKAFHEKLGAGAPVDPKSDNSAILSFFKEMVPDFDTERVYISDIRKMISWYNMLLSQNLLDFSEPDEEKPAESDAVDEKKNEAEAESATSI